MARFSFPSDPVAPKEAVRIIGGLRLTVLTPSLLRVETGNWTDMATQSVWNRNFPVCPFEVAHDGSRITVITEAAEFCLNRKTGKLTRVTLGDGRVVTDLKKGNLLGTARTLDMVNGATRLGSGVISRSGAAVLDDSRRLLLEQSGRVLPRPACTDRYYFAYGSRYRECLRDLFRLCGSTPLIPRYALGNWWSRYYAYSQEEYKKLLERFSQEQIPITVATIDMDWHWVDVLRRFGREARPVPSKNLMDRFYAGLLPGWTGYSWNTELFPDYRGLLAWLHEQGFHVTLNVHPSQGVRFFEDQYEAMCAALGRDPAKKEQISFDVTDRAFMEAYFDQLHHPYEADGVDFWWLDWQQGTRSGIPGLDPLWALNHYHTLDSGRGHKRPLILSRYAGPGSHRYPLGFSGDTFCTWKSLAFQPYFTATASNIGYCWWSHDIGGHQQGQQDDELYLRWVQYGVFSPINRLHSSNNEFMGKEPWKRSSMVRQVAGEFLRLRHRLIPYLYSANYQTWHNGRALCEPMYYGWDCEEAYQAKNEYLFGGQLLVCPVVTPRDKTTLLAATQVWLPEGRWTDLFTGRIYEGGQNITMHRDLDTIPVLARAGSIVPMYRDGGDHALTLDQPLQIHVWRGNGSFELYEDDGETNAYESGHYAITRMQVAQDGDCVRFTIHAPQGNPAVLPQRRQVTVWLRDVMDGRIQIDGAPAEGKRADGLQVELELTGREVCLEVTQVVPRKNRPRREAMVELLTRVQGSNNRKARRCRGVIDHPDRRGKLPKAVASALEELERMSGD